MRMRRQGSDEPRYGHCRVYAGNSKLHATEDGLFNFPAIISDAAHVASGRKDIRHGDR